MNPYDSAWQKLVTAARRAPGEPDATAPYGFATRVAALAMAAPRASLTTLLERFSWRALLIAGALAMASVAVNYPVLAKTSTTADDEALPDVSIVTAVYDVS